MENPVSVHHVGNMTFHSAERVPVLHRSETMGVNITETQDIEVFIDGELNRTEQVRYWHDLQTGNLSHVDSIVLK